MGNYQPALHALFACELGLSEPEIRLGAFVCSLIWQKKHDKWVNGKICTVPGFQKQLQTALIFSVTFI
jgi:hypothetical protein